MCCPDQHPLGGLGLCSVLSKRGTDHRLGSDGDAWGARRNQCFCVDPAATPLPGLSLPLASPWGAHIWGSGLVLSLCCDLERQGCHHLHCQRCFFPSQHPLHKGHLNGPQGMASFPGDPAAPPSPDSQHLGPRQWRPHPPAPTRWGRGLGTLPFGTTVHGAEAASPAAAQEVVSLCSQLRPECTRCTHVSHDTQVEVIQQISDQHRNTTL